MAELYFDGVRKSYGPTEIIRGVDLAIHDGEFVVFVGPSGCGKSTMLRMVSGLEDISAGLIKIDGRVVNDLRPVERGIAMVFQSYALYPHMTVFENMAFGLRQGRMPDAEVRARVEEASRLLQIHELLQRRPKALSGGQRQRVAIGRAIVRQPKVFLFDEPLSNLDAALRSQMRVELSDLHRRLRTNIIYVTHDQVEAMTLADRIVVLNHGKVEQFGTPSDVYDRPSNVFVAQFMGSPRMNVFPCSIERHGDSTVECRLTNGQRVEIARSSGHVRVADWASLGVRPEHMIITTDSDRNGGGMEGIVQHVELLGHETIAHVDAALNIPVTLRAAANVGLRIGDRVRLAVANAHWHFFDLSGNRVDCVYESHRDAR